MNVVHFQYESATVTDIFISISNCFVLQCKRKKRTICLACLRRIYIMQSHCGEQLCNIFVNLTHLHQWLDNIYQTLMSCQILDWYTCNFIIVYMKPPHYLTLPYLVLLISQSYILMLYSNLSQTRRTRIESNHIHIRKINYWYY